MAAQGWPFLVARGRQSGYTVRLAPDFLVEAREYGLLEAIAGSGAQVVAVNAGGRAIAVVWAEHAVTGPDIGSAEAPRDEHSRPLHLLYGFVSPDVEVERPSDVDLSRTREAALDTYRRFLADEKGFSLESSGPFPLYSTVAPLAVQPSPVSARRVAPFALAGLVAVAAVAVIAMASSGNEEPPPPPLCNPATTMRPVVTPSISQTCVPPDQSQRVGQNR